MADFYQDWFLWVEKRGEQLALKEPLRAAAMARDVALILKGEVAMLEGLLKATKQGSVFGIPLGIIGWIAKHQDPLQPMRVAMRTMRVKYGEVSA